MNNTRASISRRWQRTAQVIVTLVSAFLLAAHLGRWKVLQVDWISLALLAMILLVPVTDLVRKVKWGDFEAEIGREEVAKAQALAAIELPPSVESTPNLSEDKMRILLREDPRLALAKVRIELEEGLKRLYAVTQGSAVDLRRSSIGRLVEKLVDSSILTSTMAAALRDVIALANRAIHGEHVERSAAEELAILGTRLSCEIAELVQEHGLQPTSTVKLLPGDVEDLQNAQYRVTTVVPLVDKPVKNIYELDQTGLDSFLEGYDEYAEFLVAIERISAA